MSTLYILNNLSTGESLEITEPVIVIGRESSCDVAIVSDESSRQHQGRSPDDASPAAGWH